MHTTVLALLIGFVLGLVFAVWAFRHHVPEVVAEDVEKIHARLGAIESAVKKPKIVMSEAPAAAPATTPAAPPADAPAAPTPSA